MTMIIAVTEKGTEMRLIDADALSRQTMLEPLGNGQYEEVEIVYFRDIENAPTIDPIKHGRWKHEHLVSTGGGTYEVVRCSLCGWQYPTFETNFCPHCGARMDGGTE